MDDIEIFKLFGTVFLEDKEARKGLDEIEGKAEKTGGRFDKLKKGVGVASAAIGGAVLGAGATMMTAAGKAGDYSDRILDLNAITGMSTDSVQEWAHVTKIAGVDIESVTKASSKLTKTMDLLENGTGKQTEAIGKLGMSYDDLAKMSPDEQMDTLIKSLSEVEDAGERARIGTDLFGGSWQDLAPIVSMGADEIDKAKKEAHDLGTVLGEDALNDANNYRIEMEKVRSTLGAFGMQLGAKVAPMVTEVLIPALQAVLPYLMKLMEVAMDVAQKIIEWVGKLVDVVQAWVADNREQIDILVQGFKDFIAYIVQWVQDNKENFMAVVNAVKDFANQVIELVQALISLFLKLWDKYGSEIIRLTKLAFDNVITILKGVFNIVRGLLDVFIGLFTGDWSRMGEGLKKIWNAIWETITRVLSNIWQGYFGKPFNSLKESITKWFTGLKDDAIQWGKNMIQGFIDGIGAMVGKVKDAASNVMKGVKGFLGFNSPAEEGEGRFIEDWGANMIDGFLDGAKAMIPNAEALMNQVVGSMQPQPTATSNDSSQVVYQTYITVEGNIDRDLYDDIMTRQANETNMNIFLQGGRG